jgi:hypothetical protein
MGQRIIAENAGVKEVTYVLPNKHYIPVDMKYIGIDNLTPYVSFRSSFVPSLLPSSLPLCFPYPRRPLPFRQTSIRDQRHPSSACPHLPRRHGPI